MANPIALRLTLGNSTTFHRVKSFEHAELCRAFKLDQASYRFDLPRQAQSVDGDKSRVTGFVLRGDIPVGTIHVALDGEKFRDIDPTNRRDRLDLRQTNRN